MRAKLRNIELICKIDERIPIYFNTDPQRLKQILLKLVGNSMKFTFKDYIKVEAN